MTLTGRLNTLLLLLVLIALVTIIAMLATGVRGGPLDPPEPPGSTASVKLPGVPISSGPTTITQPGHYYLTNDINVSGAVNAITINANGPVTLDLGGFVIDGTDTAGSRGIAVSSANVRVHNGTITDFNVGIDGGAGSAARFDDILVTSNARGMQVSVLAVVTDCIVRNNTETGIVIAGTDNVVSACLVRGNGLDGIFLSASGNTIEHTKAIGNGTGSDINLASAATATIIRDNIVRDLLLASDSNVVIGNVCDGVMPDITDTALESNLIAAPGSPHENFGCDVSG